ncbi:MAG: hypothetical protein Q8S94_13390 [Pseudohongiella sp.]|nr:hypothetical protein [Pseudohongiella sp.]
MKLDIRLFIECKDEEEAKQIVATLCDSLADFSPTSEMNPSRYWKMPEFFEFAFDLGSASMASFDRLISLVPNGWTHGGDPMDLWSVWNREPGAMLLLPGTRWAEVQFNAHAG